MKNVFSNLKIVVLALLVSGCASVPNVESRLQSMQLHSNMYVVQAGETVASIAYRYRLTESELEALNPGLSNSIRAGMRINVRPGTTLSNAVRAGGSDVPIRQQRVLSSRDLGQSRQQARVDNSRINTRSEDAFARVPFDPEIRLQPVPKQQAQVAQQAVETIVDESVITEIPASSWSDEVVIAERGTLKEEIIPDTLEYEVVQGNRAAMNEDLQQLVGRWTWPTEGQVARAFAPNEVGGHGVDIAGVPGQDIRAAKSGTVVYSGRDLSGGGNLIIVRHNDGLMTTYSHVDKLFVAEDDQVAAGDPIASLGWNANRESVLRFEVREDGSPRDPMRFLPVR